MLIRLLGKEVQRIHDSLDGLKEETHSLSADLKSRCDSLSQSLQQLKIASVDTSNAVANIAQLDVWRKSLVDFFSQYQTVTRDQAVLLSLNFESRTVRHSSIAEAYQATFEWVFEGELGNWLLNGHGTFWISGRPGSGKSTLMKFIADHRRTKSLLSAWSTPNTTTIAAHYFWSPGTSLQKSHKGLLQTLLFDIFRAIPSLIATIPSERWHLANDNPSLAQKEPWNIKELSETLQRVAQKDDLPMRLCLFVDGMDEYEGDKEELCEALSSLAQSPHVKMCLASRPWNVFVNAFGQSPSTRLYMHELTRGDILAFTTGRLQSHPRWNQTEISATDKQILFEDICQRANGVFLWVHLVTQSLRNGLTDHDTLSGLKRRLASLPTDLERLFEHIINQIDPVYNLISSEELLLALHADGPLDIAVYYYHEMELRDPSYWLEWEVGKPNEAEVQNRHLTLRRRINARSGGLLETSTSNTVEFLHRTVRDFLSTPTMRSSLGAKTRSDFDPYFSLAAAYSTLIKEYPDTSRLDSSFVRPELLSASVCTILHDGLKFLSQAREENHETGIELLDELEYAFVSMEDTRQLQLIDTVTSEGGPVFVFRAILVQNDLSWYLHRKLAESKEYFRDFKAARRPPLFVALLAAKPSLEVIRSLLDGGEVVLDHGPISPWSLFCNRLLGSTKSFGSTKTYGNNDAYEDVANGLDLLKLFIRREPNPNQLFMASEGNMFCEILQRMREASPNSPELASYLEVLDCIIEAGIRVGPKEIECICGVNANPRKERAEIQMLKRIVSKSSDTRQLLFLKEQIQQNYTTSYRARGLIDMIEAKLVST